MAKEYLGEFEELVLTLVAALQDDDLMPVRRSLSQAVMLQAAVKPVWDKYATQHAALIKRIQDLK